MNYHQCPKSQGTSISFIQYPNKRSPIPNPQWQEPDISSEPDGVNYRLGNSSYQQD